MVIFSAAENWVQNEGVVDDFSDVIQVAESEFHKKFYVMEDRLQVHILKGNWVLAKVPVVSSEAARTALVGARPALHTARHSAYQRGRQLGVMLPLWKKKDKTKK